MRADDAIREVSLQRAALIDVRSEGEFAQGAVPGFLNRPILTDGERHLVGIAYKEHGQDHAMKLGYELVEPSREQRVGGWSDAAHAMLTKRALVTCWRGGLRSQIACEWLRERDVETERIDGGYKAMRRVLTSVLAELPPLVVLSGMTGSGKTELIKSLKPEIQVDLEALARHRGSSFGKLRGAPQPSQATFENALGLSFWDRTGPVLVEDESASIGTVTLPLSLRTLMSTAPVVVLEADQEHRARHIFAEYVGEPLRDGVAAPALRESLVASVRGIARRLGGSLAAKIEGEITAALSDDVPTFARHQTWILDLLDKYYDGAYRHAFERQKRQVVFRGNHEECLQWILHRFG